MNSEYNRKLVWKWIEWCFIYEIFIEKLYFSVQGFTKEWWKAEWCKVFLLQSNRVSPMREHFRGKMGPLLNLNVNNVECTHLGRRFIPWSSGSSVAIVCPRGRMNVVGFFAWIIFGAVKTVVFIQQSKVRSSVIYNSSRELVTLPPASTETAAAVQATFLVMDFHRRM